MSLEQENYLTKKQLFEKYKFLDENVLKNLLFKNIRGIREKCVRKLGKKILIKELAFLKYIEETPYKKDEKK